MKKIVVTLVAVMILFSSKMTANAAGLKDIFSSEYYADSYEDLYKAFEYDETKLFNHVKEYGLKEKRDISPILDVVYYRETYPDLNAAFGDNWDLYVNHYFEYGIKEGRDNGTDFDIIRYVNSYADLRQAFAEDYVALAKHYLEYGMKENRTKALKEVKTIPSGRTVEIGAFDKVFKEFEYAADGSGKLLRYIVYEYYSDGSLKKQTNYNGNHIAIMIFTYEYQEDGTCIMTTLDGNNTVESTSILDKDDKLLKVTFPDGSIIVNEYEGNVHTKQTYFSVNGSYSVIEYDLTTHNMKSQSSYDENGVINLFIIYDVNKEREIKRICYNSDGSVNCILDYIYEGNIHTATKVTYADNRYNIEYYVDSVISEEKRYRADGTLWLWFVYNEDGSYTYTEYDESGNPI